MKKTSVEVLDYYDEEVVKMISEKYGFEQIISLRKFLSSQSYSMLSDSELEMWEFGPAGIFDMWESEQITGDPRNSQYLRG
ncbi:MAG: hypothetical protein LBT84_03260 [Spirochaetia bacterium]|jgi:hypothetical protein|nr:hypothetical protein [Spirochaetia bacterium]